MIETTHPKLPVTEQCALLGLPRSSYYHRPQPASAENHRLMQVIDETYLAFPFFGSRQMTNWLRAQGEEVLVIGHTQSARAAEGAVRWLA